MFRAVLVTIGLVAASLATACARDAGRSNEDYCITTTLDPRGNQNRIVVASSAPPVLSHPWAGVTVFDFVGPLSVRGERDASYSRNGEQDVSGSLVLVQTDGTAAVQDNCAVEE